MYEVIRPPLAKTFKLPARKRLLKVKPGDFVKVTFKVGADEPERMWVIVQECSDIDRWTGITDNDPVNPHTAKVLPAGTQVTFHPFDIIALY